MQLTDYHAKYFAYELTKRCSSDSLEKLASLKERGVITEEEFLTKKKELLGSE